MRLSDFPTQDLKGYSPADARRDLISALTITFMAVPQGVAYALIAGVPPVMGLYAAAIPAILGSLLRSSRHVVAGPSNAISLVVGGGLLTLSGLDPFTVAVTLAFMVGVFQMAAGIMRLGSIVDYISNPVVLGYITGAGILIAVGQLPNLTLTAKGEGNVVAKIATWLEGIGAFHTPTLVLAISTAVIIVVVTKLKPNWPAAAIVLALSTALAWWFDFAGLGFKLVSDLSVVPSGFPPFSMPDWSMIQRLTPLAVACAVLSLVESSAVARSLAAQSGQRLDTSWEFIGQGAANIAAGFFSGYPTSGSLSRSAISYDTNSASRLAGVYSGVLMIVVLVVLADTVNFTPIASLAGLLMVVAYNLVDRAQIKITMQGPWSDRLAFLVTCLATWFMPLDKAIYLGVGISLVFFLRQARFLVVHQLGVDGNRKLRDVDEDKGSEGTTCDAIRILHVEGRLFFGAIGDLQRALDDALDDECVRIVVLRLKRTQGIDVTVAALLESAAQRLHAQGMHLILAGVRPEAMDLLRKTGVVETIGEEHVFPTQAKWFQSLKTAIAHAQTLIDEDEICKDCPLWDVVEPLDFTEDE